MKVKKEDLDTLTKNATKVGVLAMAVLLQTRCPVPEFYKMTEALLKGSADVRKDLELEDFLPEKLSKTLLSGEISGTIEAMELTGEFEKLYGEQKAKSGIGFKIPNSDSDPNKMN